MYLKSALCNAAILVFPDPLLPYTVVTDASQHAVGGVIMQDRRGRTSVLSRSIVKR